MENFNIQYHITLPAGKKLFFTFNFDVAKMELSDKIPDSPPSWTKLEFNQCPHCPLTVDSHPYCPLSVKLVNIIEQFKDLKSYEDIQLEVIKEIRTIYKKTSLQEALSAMMGLVIPTSGCPETAYFKPMARYHLPLASLDETIYRASAMYMLAQYFVKRSGKSPDLDFKGLKKIYKNMQMLNSAVAERIRAASKADSSINALVLLDVFTMILPTAIEDSLVEIQYLFSAYLKS